MIKKVLTIIIIFICVTIISFIITRYIDGYRIGDEFLFPEVEIEDIYTFAIVDKDLNINYVEYFMDEEDVEFIEEALKNKKYSNRFFNKSAEYPFYQMNISFELDSVEDVIISLYSNGIIRVMGNSEKSNGIVFYESKLTFGESKCIESILNTYE
jgi:hypothetical protein